MEALVEILLEFLLQIAGQALLELGLHAVAAPFRRPPNAWLAALGYLLFGAIFGGISLWLFPSYMVKNAALRWLNLFLTPIAAGACMAGIGRLRARRGGSRLRIDHFSYGFVRVRLCVGAVCMGGVSVDRSPGDWAMRASISLRDGHYVDQLVFGRVLPGRDG